MGAERKKRACVDCTERCSNIHGSSNFNSDTSSFFKVMLGDFAQALFIPPSFAKSIADLVNTDAFLEDSTGSCWKIRVCKKQKTLAFGTGWCKFIEGHSVSLGEFLVFKQTEKSVFSVKIFSTSGSERVQFCKETKKSKDKEKENPNKRKRERTLNPKEKEKKNPTKRKREGTQNPKSRKTLATSHKKDHTNTPSIQEMTRREEQKERRTRSALRRLIMKDLEDKDLLVNEEITIIPPIRAVPSKGNYCLAIKDCAEIETSEKNCEETSIICVGTEGEKIEEISGDEKDKNVQGERIEEISGNEKGKNVEGEKIKEISENNKGKNVKGEINTEQVGSLCENISTRNTASEAKIGGDLMVVKAERNQKSIILALSAE